MKKRIFSLFLSPRTPAVRPSHSLCGGGNVFLYAKNAPVSTKETGAFYTKNRKDV